METLVSCVEIILIRMMKFLWLAQLTPSGHKGLTIRN